VQERRRSNPGDAPDALSAAPAPRAARVLVTGGAGFIGSNLVDALLARGDEVTILDDLSTGRRENLADALSRGAELHVGSVADIDEVRSVLERARPDVVFHLAAQIDVRRAVEDPVFDAAINVLGTVNVLEASLAAGVQRFVLASTGGAIYGDADALPTAEDHPARPLSPYGTSKAGAEFYVNLYARLHGFSAATLRLANVYGPRQDPRGEAGVIALYCGARVDGRTPVIYGDGRQTRDFVYVGDVVDAFIAAGDSRRLGTWNVATGRETTVLELAAALGLEPRFEAERPGEVRRSCLDPSAAREALSWNARTNIEDGLRETLAAAA
jgi:UDP-glucose 4-epimerase